MDYTLNGKGDTNIDRSNRSVYVLFYEKEDIAECTQDIFDINKNDRLGVRAGKA